VFRVPKSTPRKLLVSDEYLNYVEKHPLVFGTVTAGSTCCRGCTYVFDTVCGVLGTFKNILKNNDSENDRILRKPTVKSGRPEGVCEIELIWTIENLGK
jgi:hypothetical protein